MFEPADDAGDRPGEFQNWVEQFPLPETISFPQGYRNLRYSEHGVLGVVTGIGTARAASTVMALGMDPRFDLTKAYWLVAGIAGADPADMSLGSVAWAEWLVDGDIAHEIDMREAPRTGPQVTFPCASPVPTKSLARTMTKGPFTTSIPVSWNGPFNSPKTFRFKI